MTIKKAVVIGGSNGIGLAVSRNLIDRGYSVKILGIHEPDRSVIGETECEYVYCDLRYPNEEYLNTLAHDKDINALFISSGIGRFSDFQYFHTAEIEKTFLIDTVSPIKIIRQFYDRILNSEKKFYCGVMGSITGLITTPSGALYSAAKAGICRFIESVNIELEANGSKNRILCVAPGFIDGTKFYGSSSNDLTKTSPIAQEIIEHLLNHDTLYIPFYNETYKNVIERYQKDPHEFGLSSYEYKKNSGRIKNESKIVIGYMSGTFDLFHIGHLNLIRRAKEQCDYLVVGVHASGARKGKETFIPLEERKTMVESCRYVDKVIDAPAEDSDAWPEWHYKKLFVGSDYKGSERFNRYEEIFAGTDVEIVYFPYTKNTSSTQIRNAINAIINS